MVLGARTAMWGEKKASMVSLSMQKTGSVSNGFYNSSIGTPTIPQTFTCWYRFKSFPSGSFGLMSRCAVKFGNSSSGIGFGTCAHDSYIKSTHVALNEGKYWVIMNNGNWGGYLDADWHHLAIRINTDSVGFSKMIFCDGTVATTRTSKSGTITAPTGQFSLCGRSSDDTLSATVQVSRACIFDGTLSDDEIVADMNLCAKHPSSSNLIHFWDGTISDGVLKDLSGSWDLTLSSGCSVVEETPWS